MLGWSVSKEYHPGNGLVIIADYWINFIIEKQHKQEKPWQTVFIR